MRTFRLVVLLGLCLAIGGCVVTWKAPVKPPQGRLFTQYRAPLTGNVTDVPADGKVGVYSTSYVRDILFTGLGIAWDDASIEAAARQGGLAKVYYADYEVLNVLGIYAKFTTRAYGE